MTSRESFVMNLMRDIADEKDWSNSNFLEKLGRAYDAGAAAEREAAEPTLAAAQVFASQGHRAWCPLSSDPSLLRVECVCGLREFQDASDELLRRAEQDQPTK